MIVAPYDEVPFGDLATEDLQESCRPVCSAARSCKCNDGPRFSGIGGHILVALCLGATLVWLTSVERALARVHVNEAER
jgi:hypothetical protein